MIDPKAQASRILIRFFGEEISFLLKNCQLILLNDQVEASLSGRFEAVGNIAKKIRFSAENVGHDAVLEVADVIEQFTLTLGHHPALVTNENRDLLNDMIEVIQRNIVDNEATDTLLQHPEVEKIKAIISKNHDSDVVEEDHKRQLIPGLAFDPVGPTITRSVRGQFLQIEVTSKEARIFNSFYSSQGYSAARKEVVAFVWRKTKVSDKAFSSHLANLRQKISPLGLDIALISLGQYQLIDVFANNQNQLISLPKRRGRKRRKLSA